MYLNKKELYNIELKNNWERNCIEKIIETVFEEGRFIEDEWLTVMENKNVYISIRRYDNINDDFSIFIVVKNSTGHKKLHVTKSWDVLVDGSSDSDDVSLIINSANKLIKNIRNRGMEKYDADGNKIPTIHHVRLNKVIKEASECIVKHEEMFLEDEDDTTPTYKIMLRTTLDDYITYELGMGRYITNFLKKDLDGLMETVEISRMMDGYVETLNLPGLVNKINKKCLV